MRVDTLNGLYSEFKIVESGWGTSRNHLLSFKRYLEKSRATFDVQVELGSKIATRLPTTRKEEGVGSIVKNSTTICCLLILSLPVNVLHLSLQYIRLGLLTEPNLTNQTEGQTWQQQQCNNFLQQQSTSRECLVVRTPAANYSNSGLSKPLQPTPNALMCKVDTIHFNITSE